MTHFLEDVILESLRTAILAVLVVRLVQVGRQRGFAEVPGWRMVQWGFYLLLFGTAIDITDNFPSLNRFVVIGNTPAEAFLEKVVGYLMGCLLLTIGLIRWAPTVARTHRDKAELDRLVAERTAALERSNRDLQHFAHVAAHDLREPLRTVVSFVQLLERRYGGQLDAEGREYITYAANGAKRMGQLIQDLLEYSLVGEEDTQHVEVDLATVVDEARTHCATAIATTNAQVEVSGELPRVRGDHGQLVRVFMNLIGNAVKYHSPERHPQVTISASRNGETWDVTVADNGIGIDPAYHQQIFVIFQRLHGPDAYHGTGIGLAVCKRIMECHGGSIRVESQVGLGTSMHLSFPPAESG